MILTDKHLTKINIPLRDALIQAAEDDQLTVIAVLSTNGMAPVTELNPAAFSSRVDYREALIAQRRSQLQLAIGLTIQSVQDLGLKTSGGSIAPVLVMEGSAKQILAAIELSGVQHVSLDATLALMI